MRFLITILLASIVSPIFGQVQEYILQAGDVIAITVVEHPEFSGRHKIRPDGRINYPVIGEIDVATLSTAQIVKIMQGKLASYVNNPVVSISIEAYYSNKIFVIGAVTRSGEYEIYEPVDLMKVIAMCGGLRSNKAKFFKIIRSDGTIVTVNAKEIFGTSTQYDNTKYILYPGDTMYVPESFQVPWAIISSILGIVSVSLSILIMVTNLNK